MIGDAVVRMPAGTWRVELPAAFAAYALARAGTDGLGDPAAWDDCEASFIAEDLAEDLGHAHDVLGLPYDPTAATVLGNLRPCLPMDGKGHCRACMAEDGAVSQWRARRVLDAMARHGLGPGSAGEMLSYAAALCGTLGLDGPGAVLAGTEAWASWRAGMAPPHDAGVAAGPLAAAA